MSFMNVIPRLGRSRSSITGHGVRLAALISRLHMDHLVRGSFTYITQYLSQAGKSYVVDPVNDLRPVCPNCHAMLHKRVPQYTIDELREIIEAANPGVRR
jgi:hypothetical protein